MKKILVIGSGAFAKALISVLLFNNQFVNVYGINKDHLNDLNNYFIDEYDKGNIKSKINNLSTDINNLFKDDIDIIILCIPSYETNKIIDLLKMHINEKMIIISTSKGLNWEGNDLFYTDILKKKLTPNVASLVGPTFAVDILEREKTIINIVSDNKQINNLVKEIFTCSFFQVIPCEDPVGANLLSSLKNALAIGCGLAKSIGCSNNTFSALLVIGINEIKKILMEFNQSQSETIFDFCGIGDIFLTCTDQKSRNFSFGYQIGQLGLASAIKNNKNILVEGFITLNNMDKLINISNNKEFCLFNTLISIIKGNIEPKEFIDYLWKMI